MAVVVAAIILFALAPEAEESAADPGEGWSKCGDDLWYKLDGTVLSFQGSGAMWDYGDDSKLPPERDPGGPWGDHRKNWTSGDCSITTPHQSVYAILKEGGESDMIIVWIAGGIAAILIVVAVAFFVVRSGKAKN